MPEIVEFGDDVFVNDVRLASEMEGRSLADQIKHWALIGRAIERSADFDYTKISRVLAGELETTTLTAVEKAVWSERFMEKMAECGPGEEAFFAELRKSGKAAGIDSAGNIVYGDTQAED